MEAIGHLRLPGALRLWTASLVPVKYEEAWGLGIEKFLGCPARVLREWE
jgi:hypothetical protein